MKTIHWVLILFTTIGVALAGVYYDSPALFLLGTIELVLIAVVVNLFVLLYAFRNWRANPYGRALMYSKLSLAALVNISLATILLGPDWEGRALLRALLFGGILVAQTRLLQLLFSLRNKEARQLYSDTHDEQGKEI